MRERERKGEGGGLERGGSSLRGVMVALQRKKRENRDSERAKYSLTETGTQTGRGTEAETQGDKV